jgi:hypothetical protein
MIWVSSQINFLMPDYMGWFTKKNKGPRSGSVAATMRNARNANARNANSRLSSAANNILKNLGSMGNKQERFGNKRNANNNGKNTSRRVNDLKISFAAADKAKKEFMEESEKALKKSEFTLKLDADDRKDLFISFNKLKDNNLSPPTNEKVKKVYKYFIPLYLYFAKYIPDKMGLSKFSESKIDSLEKKLETFLENINTGTVGGGQQDDSKYEDTEEYNALWPKLMSAVRTMAMWQMFSWSFSGFGASGVSIEPNPIVLFIYFVMFGMICVAVGLSIIGLLVNLMGAVAGVLYKHLTGSKSEQQKAAKVISDNPLFKNKALQNMPHVGHKGAHTPSRWKAVIENGERWYENIATGESVWTLPPGAQIVSDPMRR